MRHWPAPLKTQQFGPEPRVGPQPKSLGPASLHVVSKAGWSSSAMRLFAFTIRNLGPSFEIFRIFSFQEAISSFLRTFAARTAISESGEERALSRAGLALSPSAMS